VSRTVRERARVKPPMDERGEWCGLKFRLGHDGDPLTSAEERRWRDHPNWLSRQPASL